MATSDLKRSVCSAQPWRLSFPLAAIQHIRSMPGRTQPHLMRASDGRLHVVKFQNNPFHPRVLANEFLATQIGLWLGLPMPQVALIEISPWLVAHTPSLRVQIEERRIPCASGLQLASRFVADPDDDEIFDHLPKMALQKISNQPAWLQALPFDKWVGNADSRQTVFTRPSGQRQFQVFFVDQGDCFNAGQWTFPNLPFMGTYDRNWVYRTVQSWDSFEPILSRIEGLDSGTLWNFALRVPQEWYQYDSEALCQLVEVLHRRRSLVRDLIKEFRDSERKPFPNWTSSRRSGTAQRR